jgi:hypothetical protein
MSAQENANSHILNIEGSLVQIAIAVVISVIIICQALG